MIIFRKNVLRQETTINILFGLIKFYKFKPICKELFIMGLKLFRSASYCFRGKRKSFFEIFPMHDIKKDVLEDTLFVIEKQVLQGFKNIVFIRSGLGETLLLNLYMEQYLKNNNLTKEDTCFVGLRDNFSDLFKQYNPDITYKKINVSFDYLCFSVNKEEYIYNNRRILIYIDKNFIYSLMDNYGKGTVNNHFVSAVSEHFNWDINNFSDYKYQITDLEINKIENYIQKKKVDINNFIFISKDSISTQQLNNVFWQKLSIKLKEKGYSLIFNSKELSITEAKILCNYSKSIIGLRSGFIETLLDTNKSMHIIYTPMIVGNISAKFLKDNYTLTNYPNCNQSLINEYCCNSSNEDEVLEEILRGF